jgi:hypothetical protein
MTTDQKYDGKADNANPIEQTAENNPQAAQAEDKSSTVPTPGQVNDIVFLPPPIDLDKTISVPVTTWLARHLQTPESANLVRQALYRAFRAFSMSDYFRSEKTEDTDQAYIALRISLDRMIVRAAEQVCGPLPDSPVKVPGDLVANPYQSEAFPVLMNNPSNCIDVEELQKWIADLQDLSMTQNVVLANQKTIADNQEKQLQALTSMQERSVSAPTVPAASLSLICGVNIGTSARFGSDVDVLLSALTEYRDSRKRHAEDQIQGQEYEYAYVSAEDAQTAQDILDDLQYKIVELARRNYMAATYKGESAEYREVIDCEPKFHESRLAAFLATYARGVTTSEEVTNERAGNDSE